MPTAAEGTNGRVRTWVLVVGALAGIAIAAAGIAVAQSRAPLSAGTEGQLRTAIVGFEFAKASSGPECLIGKKLTLADKAILQARFRRRIQRFAGGPELQEWQSWNYARALIEDEWDTRQLTGCTGRITYRDFRHRNADGGVVVRAGVEQRYAVVTWDAEAGRAVPHDDWVTGVSVNDYVLRKSGGVWKVFGTDHWMFYDPATGQLGTGP